MQFRQPVTFDNHFTEYLHHLFAISTQYRADAFMAAVVFAASGGEGSMCL